MNGRDRVAFNAARAGWTLVRDADEKPDSGAWHAEYVRDGYTMRVYFTASNAVARASLIRAEPFSNRWIGRAAGKVDRVIDWMTNPAAVFS